MLNTCLKFLFVLWKSLWLDDNFFKMHITKTFYFSKKDCRFRKNLTNVDAKGTDNRKFVDYFLKCLINFSDFRLSLILFYLSLIWFSPNLFRFYFDFSLFWVRFSLFYLLQFFIIFFFAFWFFLLTWFVLWYRRKTNMTMFTKHHKIPKTLKIQKGAIIL